MLASTSDILTLAERKLDWLDERTRVLASNVANADTPDYQSRDVRPFSDQLSPFQLSLARTDPGDLSGPADGTSQATREPEEQAPDGNAVSLEHQMKLIADTNAQQQLTTTLYRKYIGLTMTALGVAGSSG